MLWIGHRLAGYPPFVSDLLWPTAGTHHRQLTGSLIAAPTRAAGRSPRRRHALSRHPVFMIQVAITSDTRKNSKVIERLMPKCISDFSKKLQRKPLIR
jgi:hypothetical protein